jgi:OFA family oxalate/formate antiporter-like MFS transporter
MSRFLVLAAAVAMQMCLGATYSWSAFVTHIRSQTGIGQGAAQVPFTLFYIVFPLTTILGGMLVGRLSPRICAVAGGLLFGTGWLVASLGGRGFGFTILGVGVLGGIGVGLAYLVPIAMGILWFPRHKGLVTGVAVAGFAAGPALISAAMDRLAPRGWTPYEVMRMCGGVFLVVLPLAGSVMRRPPGDDGAAAQRQMPARELLPDPAFRVLYFAMFAGLMAGLGVNANVKQLAPAAAAATGLSVVGCFALANAAGRIAHGWLADRVAARAILTANLVAQATLLLAAPAFLDGGATALKWFAALAGFNYGGVLVLYAAASARQWGAGRVAGAYGWLFSANIPASFAPVLAGRAYDHWQSFTVPLAVIAVTMLVAAVFVTRADSLEERAG